jgi:hypothetical protein
MDILVGSQAVHIQTPVESFALDELVNWLLIEQLTHCANNDLGPTKGGRANYIFFVTVAQAYNWVNPILTGTIDRWNWDTNYKLQTAKDIYVFVCHALIAVIPTILPTLNIQSIVLDEQRRMGWTAEQQTSYVYLIQQKTNFSLWLSNWNTWYSTRLNDGNVAASVPPTFSDLPNNSTILDPLQTQNISLYTNPSKWTPLLVQGRTQSWLTWNWENVSTTCLTDVHTSTIKSSATPFYPANRSLDIANLVSTVTQIGDSEKVQAEFWAGGPFTASPPGIFLYLWSHYTRASMVAQNLGMNSFILSGLELAVNLFEIGRICWGIKKTYAEARPIQDIRNLYASSTIKDFMGSTIRGNLWLPFQPANVVSPPFPDFTSGHSSFGQVFSNIMTAWFGTSIPSLPSTTYLRMNTILSRTFVTDQSMPPGKFLFKAGSSEIQPGLIPATNNTLHWSDWSTMTTSAGFSRQYGGIHPMSAHSGAVATANSLVPIVNSVWRFR